MKIIIVGKGAAGKDFLKKRFLDRGFKQSISYTTRPLRPTERNGVDYHFITEAEFEEMIKMKEFREWNVFGDSKWYYGTTLREFKASSLFVMTPSGVRSLTADERAECFVIYLDIEEDVRLKRLKDRYGIDDPETERRLNTDRRDFEDFKDFDLRITNPDW